MHSGSCTLGRVKRVALFGMLACFAWPAIANADGKPASLTLKAGGLFVQLDLEMNLARGAVFKPVSIAPDVSIGVSSDLTVSLVHSTFGTTGFRGGTGSGVCVTGTSGGCPHVYNNVGGEAVYSLVQGDAAVAAVGGLYSLNLDGSFLDLKIGAKTRYTAGAVSLLFTPSIYAGLNHREAATPNADQLYLPVAITYKLAPPVTVGIGSGIKGPLAGFSKFGDKYTVPLGVNTVFTINATLAVGASFTFGKLAGAPELSNAMPPATGSDFRAVHVWLNYSRN